MNAAVITGEGLYGRMLCIELCSAGLSAQLYTPQELPSAADIVLADGDCTTPEQLAALRAVGEHIIVFSRRLRDGEADGVLYLHRPMSIARLRRLVISVTAGEEEQLRFDPNTRIVRIGGGECRLSPREAALFSLLYERRGEAVTRAEADALLHIGLTETAEKRTNLCEVYIAALRRKLRHGLGAPMIETVRGVGYMLP